MNIHWPRTAENNICPWYVILWRLPWVPLLFGGRILYTAAVLGMTLSLEEAYYAWRGH